LPRGCVRPARPHGRPAILVTEVVAQAHVESMKSLGENTGRKHPRMSTSTGRNLYLAVETSYFASAAGGQPARASGVRRSRRRRTGPCEDGAADTAGLMLYHGDSVPVPPRSRRRAPCRASCWSKTTR